MHPDPPVPSWVMGTYQTGGYCYVCGDNRLFVKQKINHVLHLILSILTVGLWALFVWLPLALINSSRAPRCTVCGNKAGAKALQSVAPGQWAPNPPEAASPVVHRTDD